MTARTKYMIGFYSACFINALLLVGVAPFVANHPAVRGALVVEIAVFFLFIFWWIRRFRGRLGTPTQKQLNRAARGAKRLGFIYVGALILGLLVEGQELITLPYGLGFLLPVIPLSVAIYYLRLSARLSRVENNEGSIGGQTH